MESSVLVDSIPDFVKSPAKIDSAFKTSPDRDDQDVWEDFASSHPRFAEEVAGRLPSWVLSRKRRGSRDRIDPEIASEGRNRHLRDVFLNDFPAEFRQYIPTEWSQRFHSGDAEPKSQTSAQQNQQSPKFERQQSSEKSTQTIEGGLISEGPSPNLNQYKLRNTVDLGQKTATELSQSDADLTRNQRSMSAPPDNRTTSHPISNTSASCNIKAVNNMGTPQQEQQSQQLSEDSASNKQPSVRHIPIFVEGRDEPVVNTQRDTSASFAESRATPPKDQYFMEHDMPKSFHPTPHFTQRDASASFAESRATPPKDQYFMEHDMPKSFHPTPHFSRAFGSPFKGFSNRNISGFGPKVFNQNNDHLSQQKFRQPSNQPAAAQPSHSFHQHQQGGHSTHPQGTQSSQATHPPKSNVNLPQAPQAEPQEVNIAMNTEGQQKPPQSAPHFSNDPIGKIQLIQKDVLDLMTQVETFKGKSKKDKEYVYLDEMLTRNLIKLDDIETEGKENIRLARKEAIKCIQQCIAVLEAKAESNAEAEAKQSDADTRSDLGSSNNENKPDSTNMDTENSVNEGVSADNSQESKIMETDVIVPEGGNEIDENRKLQDPKLMEVDASVSSQ